MLNWSKKFIKEWGIFITIIALLLMSLIVIWSPIAVDGHSMDPTLADNQRLILLKQGKINRFDIVVATEKTWSDTEKKTIEKKIIKRVIGMPGDTIEYRNDTLYINGKKTDEPYLTDYKEQFQKDRLQKTYASLPESQAEIARFSPSFTATYDSTNGFYKSDFNVTVPKGEYFLMGDNRPISKDSREVGCFKRSAIEGKVVFRIWPFDKIGGLSS